MKLIQWLSLPERFAIALLIGATRCYHLTLSPLLGQRCRFHPSCSRYFIEALQKYGLWIGAWKGIVRVSRCHPWHPGGFDPP